MAKLGCFSRLLSVKKNRSKESPKSFDASSPRVEPEEFMISPTKTDSDVHFPQIGQEAKAVPSDDAVTASVVVEAAYEGGDEQDSGTPAKKNLLNFEFPVAPEPKDGEFYYQSARPDCQGNDAAVVDLNTPETVIPSGHLSDPGIGRTTGSFGVSVLKRPCSNIETKRSSGKLLDSLGKSRSYDDLRYALCPDVPDVQETGEVSPLSVKSSHSADKVMLKKHSSSQVLPSRSRKLWWRLFMWSHRLPMPQRPVSVNDASRKKSGYTSDTPEATGVAVQDSNKKKAVEEPQNQWVAFLADDPACNRVESWIHSLEDDYFYPDNAEDPEFEEELDSTIKYLNTIEMGESSGKSVSQGKKRASDEIVKANTIIQSLNTLSSVAHISGMGLKVIPAISAYTSLRAVNLSNNFIVQISAGSLPKSLHCLDLSRNKLVSIEGLRELMRLRVLNLSYNKISRIGQGLSNCTGIKELYLAGNKISDVEGLHRLLKLTVLDLSFNKITTAKALGQLVANYHSLLALNLLGNPIQSNIGDDQLRKAVLGLLPQLTYLNKQPIKPQRAREAANDSVARAALGDNGWSSRRRVSKRVSQSSSGSLVKGNTADLSGRRSSRNRSRGRH